MLRTSVPFCATRTCGKGLKEGSVTLRYLGVLPSSDGPGGGDGFSKGSRGTGGQFSGVKRGPQRFHDFPRLIVMHGAHPGHLAFKLLDRLSLSPCFSPSLLSIPSLVRASLPFSLSHIHLNVHERTGLRRIFSSFIYECSSYFRLCLSHGISPPPSWHNFPDRATEISRFST